jgi:hypothetical protein
MGPAASIPRDFAYVDTAQGGVNCRNHVMRFTDFAPSPEQSDCFTTVLRFTEEFAHYTKTNPSPSTGEPPSVARYQGIATAVYWPADFDDAGEPVRALRDAARCIARWEHDYGLSRRDVAIFWSGRKGISLELSAALFGGFEPAPAPDLARSFRGLAGVLLEGATTADLSIYEPLRLWRVPNTRHGESQLYKVRLTPAELFAGDLAAIRALAEQPRPLPENAAPSPCPGLVALWQELRLARPSPAPERASDALPSGGRVAAAALLERALSHATENGRNNTGLWLACQLRDNGYSQDEARPVLVEYAERTPQAKNGTCAPYTAEEGHASLESAFSRPARAPWPAAPSSEPAPVPPFPLETLPAGFRVLVEDAAEHMVMPADYLAVPLLVTAGAAIGNALELEVKPGWTEGPNLYAASVGAPGSKKSPAHRLANRAIRRVQMRLKRQFDEERREYVAALAAWDGAKRSERGAKPDEPVFPHVLTTDSTTEALAPMLLTAKGVALCKDELVSWVTSMNQYRGGKGADRQHFLSMWSRELIKVDRKGAPPIVVAHPCLAVVGGIQPDMMSELADASRREDGFLDRLLWSYPPPLPDRWVDEGINEASLTAVEEVFELLHRLPIHVDEEGDTAPYVVRFSDKAKVLWRGWYDEHAAEQGSGAVPSRLRGPWAKLPAQLARLALILHAVTMVAPGAADTYVETLKQAVLTPLSEKTLGAAMDLLDYFKAHARRVYHEFGQQQRGMAIRVQQELTEERSQGDLVHQVFHGHRTAELHRTLEELEAAGLIAWRLDTTTGGRGAKMWRRL